MIFWNFASDSVIDTHCEGRRPWARTIRTWWIMRRISRCETRKKPSPTGHSFYLFFSRKHHRANTRYGTLPVKLEKWDRHGRQIKAKRQMFSNPFWRCTLLFFNIIKCREKKMDMDPDTQRNLAPIFCYPQSFFFERILNLRKIFSAQCWKSQK